MSDYTTNATVNLTMNGEQPQKILDDLRKRAENLKNAIAQAASAGNKTELSKLRKELKTTERQIREMESSTQQVERALKQLDKATPKELQRTLKTLEKQLNSLERGSQEWKRQTEHIKHVRAEIDKVNRELRNGETFWERFNRKMNDWQTAIAAGAAAVTGLVMAGRSAVNAYAEMDAEMANVRKFTGMTAEQVKQLNQEFLKIDTRTSREDLNKLAQEAGRLGKTSQEDVLGFVKAADQINVALDDLGEGATLTLSKLTNIFGDEERLGTEQSLLAVGSVINELSQNCTASAPYLAQFSQRLAGVGAQAGMTIPQLMAFAAVLDSQGQAVEMSATALSKLIMDLFKETDKIAKATGLDLEKFKETLNHSTNEGLLMLLDRLKELGGMDVLAPVFKDMGEEGARASAVISALAGNVDTVRWQQQEANKAFQEATSITKEFTVQNTTVQAGLEKARKRLTELAVELGEKLAPVMRHVISSTTLMLKALNILVDFFVEYKREIIMLAYAVAAYTLVVNANMLAHKAWSVWVKTVTVSANTLKASIILLKLVYFQLTNQVRKAEVATKAFNNVCKRSPWGILISVITLAIGAIISYTERTKEAAQRQKELNEQMEQFKKELTDIDEASAEYAKDETTRLNELYKAANDEKKSKDERIKVAKKLQEMYPDYFGNLSTEAIMVGKAKDQYDKLATSIINTARARAASELIYENEKKRLALEPKQQRAQQDVDDKKRVMNAASDKIRSLEEKYNPQIHAAALGDSREMNSSNIQNMVGQINRAKDEWREANEAFNTASQILSSITAQITEIDNANETLRKKYNISVEDITSGTDTTKEPDFNPYMPAESDKDRKKREAEARRAAVKARKDFREALDKIKVAWEQAYADNLALYSQGEITYRQYLDNNRKADETYFDDRIKLFEATNLQEDEDYKELLKKKEEATAKWAETLRQFDVHSIQRRQSSEENELQMQFENPGSAIYGNETALQEGLHQIRIKALEDMQALYVKGSKEYAEYAERIEDENNADRLEKQKAYAKKITEWRKKYEYESASDRMKLELDMLEKVYQEKLISEEEYRRILADVKKKYADDALGDYAKQNPKEEMQKETDALKSLYEQGIITKEQYEDAKSKVERKYWKKSLEQVRLFGSEQTNQLLDIYEAWKDFFDNTENDAGSWARKLANLAGSVFAVMSAGMQQYSEYAQACADLETAKAEKKYEKEISLAEGNSYKVAKLEKQKEKELAKIKNDANRKMYAMQVIQAVAQTATNALNAYGSAAAVPVIGYILAPIAAAMAVAAGALQIATIKKQQQASEAQGYSKGGFTPQGAVDEEVGVVHAGEWVASQKLLANPVARPLINALDYAQRTNTIGSLRSADVSRSITAPIMLANSQAAPQVIVPQTPQTVVVEQNSEYATTMKKLADRLNEPFVTVNTITGDTGIKKAQDEYDRLIKNKTPKSKRK